MENMTWEDVAKMLNPEHHATVKRWLARGDGIAVYENSDMWSGNLGHKKFVSYGSKDAQIEQEEPPQKLPDIGGEINWKYQLKGVCREKLDGPVPV